MPFLVYEPDPFVRADICETIATAFQGQIITVAENLETLADTASGLGGPLIAVLSVPSEKVPEAAEVLQSGLKQVRTIFIGEARLNVPQRQSDVSYLSRPFSAESLLSSIRNAFSDLPQGQT